MVVSSDEYRHKVFGIIANSQASCGKEMEATSPEPKGTLTPPGSSPLRANCGCSTPPSLETPLTPDSAHMLLESTNHCEGIEEGRFPLSNQGEPLIGAKKRKAARVHRVESECVPLEGESGGLTCSVCQAVMTSQHDFTRHIRTHNQVIEDNTGSKLYECGLCQKQLSSNSSLDRHMLVHSGERPFRCHICGTHFTTNGNMHRHIRGHYRNSSSGCGSDTGESDAGSEAGSSSKRPLDNEEERQGVKVAKLTDFEEDNSCPVCGLEQSNSYILEVHIEKEHPEHHPFIKRSRISDLVGANVSLPDIAKSGFPIFPKVITDIKTDSSESSSSRRCDACGLSFSCMESLVSHLKDHSSVAAGQFKCNFCDVFFNSLAEFTTHRSWHLREQIESQKKEPLTSLLELHSKGNPQVPNLYSSAGIPVSLVNSSHSPLHLSSSESHPISNLSGVPRLAFSSRSSSNLSHEEQFAQDYRTMKLNGQYPCRLCKEVFANLRKLKSHNLVHMIAPPYQCNLCSFVSNDKNTLKEHMKNHKGDTPYECNLCSLSFTTKANCERHIKNIHGRQSRDEVKRCMSYNPQEEGQTNTEKSPETICSICSIDCKSRSVLRDHMRSSHPEGMDKPFSCKVCQGSFNTDNDAYRHIVQVHADSIQSGNMKELVECNTKREGGPDLSSVEAILRISKFSKLPLAITSSTTTTFSSSPPSSSSPLPSKSQQHNEGAGIPPPPLTHSDKVFSGFPIVTNLSTPIDARTPPPHSGNEDFPLDLSMNKNKREPCDNGSETSGGEELNIIDEAPTDPTPQDLSQKLRKENQCEKINLNLSISSIKDDSSQETASPPLKDVRSFPMMYPGQLPVQFYPFQQQYPFLVNPFGMLPPVAASFDHVQLLEQYQEIKRGLLPSGGSIFPSANSRFMPSSAPSFQLSALALASQSDQQQQPSLSGSSQFNDSKNIEKQQTPSESPASSLNKSDDTPQFAIKNTVLVKKPKQRRYRTERPWRCDLCDKGFTLRSNMERHMKQQHPDLWQHRPRGSSTPKLNTTSSKDFSQHDLQPLDAQMSPIDETKESLNDTDDLSKEEEETELVIDDEEDEEEEDETWDEENKEDNNKKEDNADLASVHTILSAASTHNFPFFPSEAEESGHDEEKDAKKSAYSSAPQKQKCPFCNRKFPWSSSLVRHIRTHTGQKPYLCPVCHFPFTTKSNCDRHLQRKHPDSPHTLCGDRPHKCLRCPGAAFTSVESLRKHEMFKHDRHAIAETSAKSNVILKYFRCHVCEVPFHTNKETLRHISDAHPVVFRSLRNFISRINSPPSKEKSDAKPKTQIESSIANELVICMLCFSKHRSTLELREHVTAVHIKPRTESSDNASAIDDNSSELKVVSDEDDDEELPSDEEEEEEEEEEEVEEDEEEQEVVEQIDEEKKEDEEEGEEKVDKYSEKTLLEDVKSTRIYTSVEHRRYIDPQSETIVDPQIEMS